MPQSAPFTHGRIATSPPRRAVGWQREGHANSKQLATGHTTLCHKETNCAQATENTCSEDANKPARIDQSTRPPTIDDGPLHASNHSSARGQMKAQVKRTRTTHSASLQPCRQTAHQTQKPIITPSPQLSGGRGRRAFAQNRVCER